jgi:hypothetical protein
LSFRWLNAANHRGTVVNSLNRADVPHLWACFSAESPHLQGDSNRTNQRRVDSDEV